MMAREMKNSGIQWFPIMPSNWNVCRIKNIIDVLTDYTANGSFGDLAKNVQYLEYEDYARLVRLTDLRDDLENEGIYVSQSSYEYLSKSKLFGGEILIANVGAYAGLFCEMPEIDKRATLGPNMFLVRTNQNMLQHYLLYLGNSRIVEEQLTQKAVSAAQPKLNKDDIKTVVIPIPCIEEQQKIADYLDKKCAEIDALSSDIQSQIDILENYKKSVITEAVTKGLNPDAEMKKSKNDYLGIIPAHWIEKKLRFLGICQNGISKSSEYFGEGYPFVSYGDVYRNFALSENGSGLIKSNINDRNIYSVKYGDIFFTRTSETIEEVGIAATCLKTIEDATFAGFVIRFRPNNFEELLPVFSKYYFRSEIHRKFFVKEMNLVTRASLSQELLKNLPVLLPPLKEQEEIAIYLDNKCFEIDESIKEKRGQLEILEQYKKSLIYEYVTGKKGVLTND